MGRCPPAALSILIVNKMTKIHLIRHGETEWNAKGRLQGHKDSPLTQLGKAQAQKVKNSITEKIDIAYSSPSNRAIETAQIILNGANQPIKTTPELKEINLGVWEGKRKEEVVAEYPDEYKAFWNNPSKFLLDQAETFEDLQNRVIKAVLEILKIEDGKTVLLVSHHTPIKIILSYFENRPIDKIWDPPFVGNGSHSIIEKTCDGQIKIVSYSGLLEW